MISFPPSNKTYLFPVSSGAVYSPLESAFLENAASCLLQMALSQKPGLLASQSPVTCIWRSLLEGRKTATEKKFTDFHLFKDGAVRMSSCFSARTLIFFKRIKAMHADALLRHVSLSTELLTLSQFSEGEALTLVHHSDWMGAALSCQSDWLQA